MVAPIATELLGSFCLRDKLLAKEHFTTFFALVSWFMIFWELSFFKWRLYWWCKYKNCQVSTTYLSWRNWAIFLASFGLGPTLYRFNLNASLPMNNSASLKAKIMYVRSNVLIHLRYRIKKPLRYNTLIVLC